MASKKSYVSAIKAVGLTAVAGLSLSAANAANQAAQEPAQNWIVEKTNPNDAGCARTTIAKPREGNESRSAFYLFDRPANLDIENISDHQLESCGLPPLGGIRNLPKTSKEYQAWLTLTHGLMKARQLDPRHPAPLPAGYPPMPPPPVPSGGPPKPYPYNHAFNESPSSVAPGGT